VLLLVAVLAVRVIVSVMCVAVPAPRDSSSIGECLVMSVTGVHITGVLHWCVYRQCVVGMVAGGCAGDVGDCLSSRDVCLSVGGVLSWL
jgi:hypothetical protein